MNRYAVGGSSGMATVCGDVPKVLSDEDLAQVSGGILPALGFAGAVIGHTGLLGASGGSISMGMGLAAHLLSGFGLGMATYSLARSYGGGLANRKVFKQQ